MKNELRKVYLLAMHVFPHQRNNSCTGIESGILRTTTSLKVATLVVPHRKWRKRRNDIEVNVFELERKKVPYPINMNHIT